MPSGGGGFVTTPDIAPSNIPGPIDEEPTATKEVIINLGDNAFVSTEMVRELMVQINEEIGDGVRIRT